MLFQDRRDAGRQLAEKLADYRDRPDVLVLALPRGGVPVGFEVARALGAPLDVFLGHEADESICAQAPDPFHAVGLWYDDFSQTTDAEVRRLLEQAERERRAGSLAHTMR